MVRPNSSVTSRKAGEVEGAAVAGDCGGACAWETAPLADSSAAAQAEHLNIVRTEGNGTTLLESRESSTSKKKAPCEWRWGVNRAFSREKRTCFRGMERWPGLRLLSRLQWRDRGRFARPSPLPLPANLRYEFMLGIWGCQRTALCAGNDAPWKLGASRRYRFDYAARNSSRDWALGVGISDFSSWACAFRPVRATLPGNPRGDKAD